MCLKFGIYMRIFGSFFMCCLNCRNCSNIVKFIVVIYFGNFMRWFIFCGGKERRENILVNKNFYDYEY